LIPERKISSEDKDLEQLSQLGVDVFDLQDLEKNVIQQVRTIKKELRI